MLLAAIKKSLFFSGVKKINNHTVDNINSVVNEIQNTLNDFRIKMSEKGIIMGELELSIASGLEDVVDVMNDNITKINTFLSDINEIIKKDSIKISAMGSISDINFRTNNISGTLKINESNIEINLKGVYPIVVNSKHVMVNNQLISVEKEE